MKIFYLNKMLRVTCAIIRNEDNEILAVQRGGDTDHPFKWEFPGGKVQKGESEEECILREIGEELSVEIVICSRLEDVDYDYGKKHILLIPFVCDTLDDLPVLTEHVAFKWMSPAALRELDFSEADVIVADNYLKSIGTDYSTETVTGTYKIDPEDEDEEFRAMVSSTMGAREVEWIAASAVENPAIFRKLFGYSFSPDKKLAFHSSWALAKVVDNHPDLFIDYLAQIIESLEKLENESTLRSFLRILTFSDMSGLSSRDHGLLADYCFSALRSLTSAIAVKAYSMEIIYKIALIYPGLVHELAATISMLQGEGSAGIVARGSIILKRLAEITKQ
jgi:8-oxo-dGTP diphosphatase